MEKTISIEQEGIKYSNIGEVALTLIRQSQKPLTTTQDSTGCPKMDNCTFPLYDITDPVQRMGYVLDYCSNGKHGECRLNKPQPAETKPKNRIARYDDTPIRERRKQGMMNEVFRTLIGLYKNPYSMHR